MDVFPISIDASCATHAGKVRERNEDSCLVRTDVGLWAVADGMGGHEAGDLASRTLVESLNAIEKPEAALDLVEQCEAQIFHANQQIMGLSRAHNGATIGTTAAVLPRPRRTLRSGSFTMPIYLIKSSDRAAVTRPPKKWSRSGRCRVKMREVAQQRITRAVGAARTSSLNLSLARRSG